MTAPNVQDRESAPRDDGASDTTTAHVDRAIIHGIAWTAIAKWSTQALTWISTVVVARLLLPADYGVVGMAMTFIGVVQMIGEFGLGSAIVQNRKLTDDQIARLYGGILLIGATIMLLSFLSAVPVGAFFKADAVVDAVRLLSVLFLLTSVQMVPRSLLHRDLRFKALAGIDTLTALSGSLATLVCAYLGLGFWALVVGNVFGNVAATVALLVLRPHRVRFSRDIDDIRPALRFGGHMTAANVAWYAYTNVDVVVIGRMLGSAAAGVYGIAQSIASAPIGQVTGLVGRVAGGVFSATQDDRAALRRYVSSMIEVTAFAVLPLGFGLSLVAHDAVTVIVGTKWLEAVVPIQLLAAGAGIRTVSPILINALIYTGHADCNAKFTVASALVYPVLFIGGAIWGLPGVAAVWVIVPLVMSLPLALYYTRQRLGFGVDLLRDSLTGPVVATATMVTALMLAKQSGWLPSSPAARLPLLIGLGAVAYLAVIRMFFWSRVEAVVAFVRGRRRG